MLMSTRYNAGRIRVKDCPFGQPDGTVNQFQLVDRHGHAVTQDVRIQSIHQTDWQGRVELSNSLRTTHVYPTELGTLPGSWSAWDSTANVTDIGDITVGGTTFSHCARVTDGDRRWKGALTSNDAWWPAGAAPDTFYLDILLRKASSDTARFEIDTYEAEADGATNKTIFMARVDSFATLTTWGTPGAIEGITLEQVQEGIYRLRARAIGNPATNNTARCIVSSNAGDQASTVDVLAVNVTDEVGAYILGGTSVADYTHDGQGGITTGQVPGATASLDWTGTARRA